MRKYLGIAALIVSLIPVPSAAAQTPVAYAGGSQIADATWLVREDHGLYMYFALAFRQVDSSSTSPDVFSAVGVVARGDCEKHKGRGFTVISCSAGGRAYDLAPEDFEFDPLLGSARMRLEAKGVINEVSWTGEGVAPSYQLGTAGDIHGAYIYGGMGRAASAEGEILGRAMAPTRARFDDAFLSTSADGFAAHGLPIVRWYDGDRFEVLWRARFVR